MENKAEKLKEASEAYRMGAIRVRSSERRKKILIIGGISLAAIIVIIVIIVFTVIVPSNSSDSEPEKGSTDSFETDSTEIIEPTDPGYIE